MPTTIDYTDTEVDQLCDKIEEIVEKQVRNENLIIMGDWKSKNI